MKNTIIIALLLISAFSAKQIQAQSLNGFTIGEKLTGVSADDLSYSEKEGGKYHVIYDVMVAGIMGNLYVYVLPSDLTIYTVSFRSKNAVSLEKFMKTKDRVEKKYKVKLSKIEEGGKYGSHPNVYYSYEYESDKLSVYCAKLVEKKEIFIRIESTEIRDRF